MSCSWNNLSNLTKAGYASKEKYHNYVIDRTNVIYYGDGFAMFYLSNILTSDIAGFYHQIWNYCSKCFAFEIA